MAAGTVSSGRLIAGRYRIIHELGRGGMAVVYRAHDEQLGRDVALKLLDSAADGDSELSPHFLDEARAAAALPNPYVVTIFDAGQHEGRAFIVMELLEGGDLRARLRREGRLEPREAARMAFGVARGLAATHARGLVHCDVKPLNVLLTASGEPRLVDFGIARVASGTNTLPSSEIVGSAAYLSPEQVRGERIDARTDVYALGIVLYELLAGQAPFRGSSLAEIAAQRLHRPPRPIGELAPGTPPALAAIVERALALDPHERFADAGAMAAALEAVLEELPDERPSAERGRHEETTRVVTGTRDPGDGDAEMGRRGDVGRLERGDSTFSASPRLRVSASRPEGLYKSSTFPYRVPGRRLALLVGIVALGLAGLVGIIIVSSRTAPEQVAVPAVAGLAYDEAARRLEAAGLAVNKEEQVTRDSSRGMVVMQEPREGERAPKGGTVRLVVSQGVEVPSLVGKHWDEVKPWLDEHGWRIGRLRFVVADRKDFGTVVAQEPPAEAGPVAEKAGTPLSITVAGPPEATRTGFQTAPAQPPRAEPPGGSAKPEAAKPEAAKPEPKAEVPKPVRGGAGRGNDDDD